MIRKLMFVLAMLAIASFAFAQQTPTGQGPTDLNGGLTSTPGGFTGSGPNNQGGPGLGRHDLKDEHQWQRIRLRNLPPSSHFTNLRQVVPVGVEKRSD